MQNDMLKNNVAPWQEKGRWYHGLIDLNTSSFVQNHTDAELYLKTDIATLGSAKGLISKGEYANFTIIDVKMRIRQGSTRASGSNVTAMYYLASDGRIGFVLYNPTYDVGSYADIWAFLVEL